MQLVLSCTLLFLSLNYVNSQISFQTDPQSLINDEWSLFKLTYNKTYASPQVEAFRREIFIANRAKITALNQEFAKGTISFTSQINVYSDMLFNEFSQLLNGFKRVPDSQQRGSFYVPAANAIIPAAVDWRELGAVTPVKNQGTCASCYAFAVAGAVEGQHYRKTGQLLELSAQQIVDCSKPQGNDGCGGGSIEESFEHCIQQGLNTEAAYPYQETEGQCRFRPEALGERCTGYERIAEGDEKGLMVALATKGPIAVGLNVVEALQNYKGGIFDMPSCGRGEEINHAVLLVGYGEESNGKKYWLLKNSYGPQWGEGGYLKLARDAGNLCGIATNAAYPLV